MDPYFRNFIDDRGEKRILEAIGKAEKNTSGEIRVHLNRRTRGDVMKRAVDKFRELKMDRTALRNAVLIYVDTDRKQFAVVGDEGIHANVGQSFWESLRDILQAHFSRGDYVGGIEKAILSIGEQLKNYFPYREDDINELPDDISTS